MNKNVFKCIVKCKKKILKKPQTNMLVVSSKI